MNHGRTQYVDRCCVERVNVLAGVHFRDPLLSLCDIWAVSGFSVVGVSIDVFARVQICSLCDEKFFESELREPKKKKVRPGTILRDPYPIIFWNKLGIPPCKELWPAYMGIFDGYSVIVEDPGDMHEISTMGYFGKRLMCRRGYEQNIGDIPVVRERQWKRRVEWAAECGYILVPLEKGSHSGSLSMAPSPSPVSGPDVSLDVARTELVDKGGGVVEGEGTGSEVQNDCGGDGDQKGNPQREEKEITSGDSGMQGDEAQSQCKELGRKANVGLESRLDEAAVEGSGSSEKESQKEASDGCEVSGKGNGDGGSLVAQAGSRDKDCDAEVEEGRIHPAHDDGKGIECRDEIQSSGTPLRGISEGLAEASEVREEERTCIEGTIVKNHSKLDDSKGEGEGERPPEGQSTSGSGGMECTTVGNSLENVTVCGEASRGHDEEIDQSGEDTQRSTTSCDHAKEDLEGKEDSVEMEESAKDTGGEVKGVGEEGEVKCGGEGSKMVSPGGDVPSKEVKGDKNGELDCGSMRSAPGEDNASRVEGESSSEGILEVADERSKGDGAEGSQDFHEAEKEEDKGGSHSMSHTGVLEAVEEEGRSEEGDTVKGRTPGDELGATNNKVVNETERAECSETSKEVSRKRHASDGNISDSDVVSLGSKGDGEGEEVGKAKKAKIEEVHIGKSGDGQEGGVEEESLKPAESITPKVSDSTVTEVCEEHNGSQKRKSANEKGSPKKADKSQSECEVVDIEDEASEGGERGTPSLEDPASTSTPQKHTEVSQAESRVPSCEDSDDDIMEVSVEEEVKEVAKVSRGRSGDGSASSEDSEKARFQKMLCEIRKTLPKDVEVMEVSVKEVRRQGRHRGGGEGKSCRETTKDNEDDDVIEINLRKSDMIDLEGCGEDDDNSELNCREPEQRQCLWKKIRKESGGFRRMEGSGCGRGNIQLVEAEGSESASTGNAGSDCEVAPCIVVPDTDSEDEDSVGAPHLESDPSIFLPSLDVLQLIPEEAFFLAYGLGCLVVWDVRGMGARHHDADKDSSDDSSGESVSDDECNSPELDHSVEKASGGVGNKRGGSSSNSVSVERNNAKVSGSLGEEKVLKSVNGCSSENFSTSLNEGAAISVSIKKGKGGSSHSLTDPTKVSSHVDKKAVLQKSIGKENGGGLSLSSKVLLKESTSKEASKGTPGDDSDPVPESKVTVEGDVTSGETSRGETLGLSDAASRDEVLSAEKDEKDSDSNLNDSVNILYDAGSADKTPRTPNGGSGGRSPTTANGSEGPAGPVVNGASKADPIAVIDLADSPPHSRQWAKKEGWSSNDEEDVVAMNTDTSREDPQSSASRVDPTGEILNRGYHEPMTILELWNAFRSCRASESPTALPFQTTYAVYHHFRAKRWVVKPGIHFGGDFLLYKDGPPFYHASYLVLIDVPGPDGEARFNWQMLSGFNRLAENVAKDLMICRVEWPPSTNEEELCSPECLTGLVVQEVLARRWVSMKERMSEDEFQEDDSNSFIPLNKM